MIISEKQLLALLTIAQNTCRISDKYIGNQYFSFNREWRIKLIQTILNQQTDKLKEIKDD